MCSIRHSFYFDSHFIDVSQTEEGGEGEGMGGGGLGRRQASCALSKVYLSILGCASIFSALKTLTETLLRRSLDVRALIFLYETCRKMSRVTTLGFDSFFDRGVGHSDRTVITATVTKS